MEKYHYNLYFYNKILEKSSKKLLISGNTGNNRLMAGIES